MATIEENIKLITNDINVTTGADPDLGKYAQTAIALVEILGSIAKSLEKIAANSGGEP